MQTLELKIHPPIVLVLCGALAWLISRVAGSVVDVDLPWVIVIAPIAVGCVLAANAVLEFFRVKTTIHPTHPEETSSLVTNGVFRITRNPMYLGLLLLLIGWVMFLGNVFGIAVLFVFVAYITRFQISPEERIMSSKFGQAYTDYCRHVRRWI